MSASSQGEGSISDPYVEHLRKKYLVKDDTGSSLPSLSSSGNGRTTEVGTFSDLPPNPSLTESERKHYNRAMKELTKALKISENNLMLSVAEFEETMKEGTVPTQTPDKSSSESVLSETAGVRFEDSDTVGKSTTLPTLSSAISKANKVKMSTFATSEEALSRQSTLTEFDELSKIYSHANPDGTVSISSIRAIYIELMSIYQKLQNERCRIAEQQNIENELEGNFDAREEELVRREATLLQKEKDLLEQEHALSLAESNMKRKQQIVEKLEGVELEVQERLDLLQQHHNLELERLDAAFVDKCREVKRLKASFDTVRDHNENLRTQTTDLADENRKLKVQNNKLKKRVENLQRRQDFKDLKPKSQASMIGKENALKKSKPLQKSLEGAGKPSEGSLEALSVVLEWLCELQLKDSDMLLRPALSKSQDKIKALGIEYITDKCLKVLPLFVGIVRSLPSQSLSNKQQIAFLSFIYWSLCHLDDSQHSLVTSTARRLGEELYKPVISATHKKTSASLILATTAGSSAFNNTENLTVSSGFHDLKSYPNVYFRSSCPEIRMLSSFIILKTLHQVDVLAHVFDHLAKDLKEETNRETFIDYKAGHIVLPYVTYKANGALLSNAVDVVLQMSVESALLTKFLEQCSNEAWFRAFSSALRVPTTSSGISRTSIGVTTLEKLSIILQKLSKMKSNRRFFDAFSMARNLQEWYRSCDSKNTFLSLNLRSILFNLDLLKGVVGAKEN